MDPLDRRSLAKDEYRTAREALAVLEHALPAFRELVTAFRQPMHRFLAIDAATPSAGLAELAQTLSVHAMRLSEGRQIISANVAMAMDSLRRCRDHLHAVDDGRRAFGEMHGLVDGMVRAIADVARLVAEAEQLLDGEVQQMAQQLVGRARR